MYKALLVCILIAIGSIGYSQEKQIETTPLKLTLKLRIRVSFIFTGDGTKHNTVIQIFNLKEMTTTSPCMMWRHKIVKRHGTPGCI